MTEEVSDFDRAVLQQLETAPPATGTVHDFSHGGWGHDATFVAEDGGLSGTGHLWLAGRPKIGDRIILRTIAGRTSRYRLVEVTWRCDPSDMYSYRAVFDPRTSVSEMTR